MTGTAKGKCTHKTKHANFQKARKKKYQTSVAVFSWMGLWGEQVLGKFTSVAVFHGWGCGGSRFWVNLHLWQFFHGWGCGGSRFWVNFQENSGQSFYTSWVLRGNKVKTVCVSYRMEGEQAKNIRWFSELVYYLNSKEKNISTCKGTEKLLLICCDMHTQTCTHIPKFIYTFFYF